MKLYDVQAKVYWYLNAFYTTYLGCKGSEIENIGKHISYGTTFFPKVWKPIMDKNGQLEISVEQI